MNTGRDYAKACRQAQANADWSGQPRYLVLYNRHFWIDAERTAGTIRMFLPERDAPLDTSTVRMLGEVP